MHRGAVAVFDADGAEVTAIGDIDKPVFPRSAVKAIQALPLVESGAADAFGLGVREIAMACASHSGEPAHAELAAAMLGKAGLDAGALECGAHWPTSQTAALALAAGGQPSALHNNCSGKHAGFLCTCRHLGIDHHGYVGAGHGEQKLVREAMEAVTGAAHGADVCGVDGCSIPTYAVPLRNLATGFARMVTGRGLGPQRAAAARRIVEACMAEPFFVAGTDRADTRIMELGKGRVFTRPVRKACSARHLPNTGWVSLKCDDGATRGPKPWSLPVLAGLLKDDEELASGLRRIASPVLKNWNGIEVGAVRPAGALAAG